MIPPNRRCDFTRIDERQDLGFSLHAVARLYTRRFEQSSRTLSLKLAQCRLLAMLAENEGVSQKRLWTISRIAPVRLGRLLGLMEVAGWVERHLHHNDRRKRLLAVTKNARPVLRRIQNVTRKTYVEAVRGLPTDEIATMLQVLECVRSNLSDRNPIGADPIDTPGYAALTPHRHVTVRRLLR